VSSCDSEWDKDGDTVREGVTLLVGELDADADFSRVSVGDAVDGTLLDNDNDLTEVMLSEGVGEPTVLEWLREAVPPVNVALDDQVHDADTDSDSVTDALSERGLLSLGVTSGVPDSVGEGKEAVSECSAVWLSEAVTVSDGVPDGSSDSVRDGELEEDRDRRGDCVRLPSVMDALRDGVRDAFRLRSLDSLPE
jgi:hypothetical protein